MSELWQSGKASGRRQALGVFREELYALFSLQPMVGIREFSTWPVTKAIGRQPASASLQEVSFGQGSGSHPVLKPFCVKVIAEG